MYHNTAKRKGGLLLLLLLLLLLRRLRLCCCCTREMAKGKDIVTCIIEPSLRFCFWAMSLVKNEVRKRKKTPQRINNYH